MNETVKEWVAKAEGDYWTASREFDAKEQPNFDAVCFHAQQCIEKLMKALLIHQGILPPKTHDLVLLDQLLKRVFESWSWSVEDLRFLTRAAIVFRYPGESATRKEAAQAFDICINSRQKLLSLFEQPT